VSITCAAWFYRVSRRGFWRRANATDGERLELPHPAALTDGHICEVRVTRRGSLAGTADAPRVFDEEGSDVNVKDIMTRNPITIDPEAPIGTAVDVMVDRKIRHLPVVDARGAIVGIITDRDLRSAALAPALEQYLSATARRRLRGVGIALENLLVKNAMTHNPVTTTPDLPVTQAAALMLERHVGSLLVVDADALVGIVTDRDAVKALSRQVPALRRLGGA
jgi:acetoin utilization protein AcuB